MKNMTLLILSVLLILSSCSNHEKKAGTTLLGNLIEITENEQKGIDEILEYYGGYCAYSVGFDSSTESGTTNYFEFEISESRAVEKYKSMAEMPASNVAYLFYKNLGEEKSNYEHVNVILKYNNGGESKFVFSKNDLELVDKRMPTVIEIIELIKRGEFEEIKSMLAIEDEYAEAINSLVSNMENQDTLFGNVIEFHPYGFRMNETVNGKRGLHISGAVFRDKQNHEFSVDFDLEQPENRALTLGYKL